MAVVHEPTVAAGLPAGARTYLGYAVTVVLAGQVGLVMTGVYLDQHRVDGGTLLDRHSYMDNAGSGLGWLTGSVLAPLLALALLAVAAGARARAGGVLALTLVVLGCTVYGRDVPVLGLVQGGASCLALLLAVRVARE